MKMITVSCIKCNKDFQVTERHYLKNIKRGCNFICSRNCSNPMNIIKKCKVCDKDFVCRRTYDVNNKIYCSRECMKSDPAWIKKLSEKNRETAKSRGFSDELKEKLVNARKESWRKYYKQNPYIVNGIRLNQSIEYVNEYKKNIEVCEICGEKLNSKGEIKRLCVDHDHRTNNFRGILCNPCNTRLGWYENNKEAIDKYLKRK